jgi:hypothetical protein
MFTYGDIGRLIAYLGEATAALKAVPSEAAPQTSERYPVA